MPPRMPHSAEEKQKTIARLRRLRGQVEGVERAIEDGASCGAVLQQIAALRGAVNGLMRQVLESHLRQTFEPVCSAFGDDTLAASIEDTVKLVHRYLK